MAQKKKAKRPAQKAGAKKRPAAKTAAKKSASNRTLSRIKPAPQKTTKPAPAKPAANRTAKPAQNKPATQKAARPAPASHRTAKKSVKKGFPTLSAEQQLFIQRAHQGKNILVEACVGSGKTTAIQALCESYNGTKRILYLTYNRLLKLDAKARITQRGVTVTNYHGWAWQQLYSKFNMRCGISDIIQTYNRYNPPVDHYDLLVLDEYQDCEEEMSVMLRHIKDANPGMQIIAVGDMAQKIYDKTRLDVAAFMDEFLGGPGQYIRMEFSRCFRLSSDIAQTVGTIWGKNIVGVNKDCVVKEMTFDEAFDFISACDPADILCLGGNIGMRSRMLNELEEQFPARFNKQNCWSNSSEGGSATEPGPDCAIFTTYDACKGMERRYCFIFDWTEEYWHIRLDKPDTRYEILRNVFCVAASRGKELIVFVHPKKGRSKSTPLSARSLMTDTKATTAISRLEVAGMFDFRFIEDVEDAYRALDVTEVEPAGKSIDTPVNDCLIDITPCLGIYQKVAYFEGCDIDRYVDAALLRRNMKWKDAAYDTWELDRKTLYLTALETQQSRYLNQVATPFISDETWRQIEARLNTHLPKDCCVQVRGILPINQGGARQFVIDGMADAIKDGVVYELRFTAELQHTHFLQCAMHMLLQGAEVGRVWNVCTGQMFEVRIPDRETFLRLAVKAATKNGIRNAEPASSIQIKKAKAG